MNYMDKIAEMFGVNLGEEFRVKERGNIMFKITKEGLFNNTGTQDTVLLNEILTGRANIERCQWTPDFNERYYCWCGVSGNWYIDSFIYYDDDFDALMCCISD